MKIYDEIRKLARQRQAVILAHHYQVDDVKGVADYTGDSYFLSKIASEAEAKVIVLCGVRFMAESAAILASDKKVLLPVAEAGCPLADTITAEDMIRLREENAGVPVVSYVNSSAAVKALSDYCCTSSNAVAVVRSVNSDRIIFVPDGNLGDYVARKTGKKIISWRGFCHVHHKVRSEDIQKIREKHPDAIFVAHPECRPEVLAMAEEVASTSGIFKFVSSSSATTFIIGTEEGVLGRLQRENAGKAFLFPRREMICPNMKLTTIGDVLHSLEEMENLVTVEEDTAGKARAALEKMVAITG